VATSGLSQAVPKMNKKYLSHFHIIAGIGIVTGIGIAKMSVSNGAREAVDGWRKQLKTLYSCFNFGNIFVEKMAIWTQTSAFYAEKFFVTEGFKTFFPKFGKIFGTMFFGLTSFHLLLFCLTLFGLTAFGLMLFCLTSFCLRLVWSNAIFA
jgi:hypothetical protein